MPNSDLSKFSKALSPANFSSEHMSLADKKKLHMTASKMVREIAAINIREQGFAMIQTTALRNVLELSSYQELATNVDAEARIKFLLDEYTKRANQRLGGN